MYSLSGICIVCWGFVLSVGALYNQSGPHPPSPPGSTVAVAVVRGGAGGPPPGPSAGGRPRPGYL